MQLPQVGNVLTPTGQSLYPKFPPLPTTVLQDKPGFYGPMLPPGTQGADDMLHNLYEEIPCIGVQAEAIQAAIMDQEPGIYPSVVTDEDYQPNANLLGFRARRLRDLQASIIVTDAGIDANDFPNYPTNSGINIELMQSISDIMSKVTCFKTTSINFNTLNEVGSLSQIAISIPHPIGVTRNLTGTMHVTTLTKMSDTVVGATYFYCSQLYKQYTRGPHHQNWCIFTPRPQFPIPPPLGCESQSQTSRTASLLPCSTIYCSRATDRRIQA